MKNQLPSISRWSSSRSSDDGVPVASMFSVDRAGGSSPVVNVPESLRVSSPSPFTATTVYEYVVSGRSRSMGARCSTAGSSVVAVRNLPASAFSYST